MEIKLSILIASTLDRQEMTYELLRGLQEQATEQVEILLDYHETNCIGKKRNDLLARASGKYVVFIDSDDHVPSGYVELIIRATQNNPDCIGINGILTTNGVNEQRWFISKQYGRWYLRGNQYFRTPNHISPVKRELALQAGFPEVKFAEDYEFSMRLLPLLKTEVIIKEPLYHYDYRTKK